MAGGGSMDAVSISNAGGYSAGVPVGQIVNGSQVASLYVLGGAWNGSGNKFANFSAFYHI
jgi:hypothetical protein